jgi:hypothetical protein
MPYVDRGACPFEGCVYRDWKATARVEAVELSRTKPWTSSGRVLFTIAPGETVTAVTGVVVTTVPGKATRFGGPNAKDDVIYLLTYHGEGVYTAWVNGTVVRDFYITNFEQPDLPGAGYSACVRTQTCDGKVLSYAQKTWWVQLRNAKGQIGWTDQAQCFDGRDAFGGR